MVTKDLVINSTCMDQSLVSVGEHKAIKIFGWHAQNSLVGRGKVMP